VNQERLWAPWRVGYVQGEKEDDPIAEGIILPEGADPKCFLCVSAADPDARRRHVIHRSERTITLLNRYPYNNGHLLVAPIVHRGRLDELTGEEQSELMSRLTQMVGVLEKALKPGGFNIGLNLGAAAGAGLPGHLHWHIVPRWIGDSNFMPSVAGVKVIPQSLDALWEILTEQVAAVPTTRRADPT